MDRLFDGERRLIMQLLSCQWRRKEALFYNTDAYIGALTVSKLNYTPQG